MTLEKLRNAQQVINSVNYELVINIIARIIEVLFLNATFAIRKHKKTQQSFSRYFTYFKHQRVYSKRTKYLCKINLAERTLSEEI